MKADGQLWGYEFDYLWDTCPSGDSVCSLSCSGTPPRTASFLSRTPGHCYRARPGLGATPHFEFMAYNLGGLDLQV